MQTIKIELTTKSLNDAIKQVQKQKEKVEHTVSMFLRLLAIRGADVAKMYVGKIDTGRTINSIEGMLVNKDKAVIVAGGHAVWLEFGTGVAKNSEPYPDELPPGISPIGTYGKGHGSNPDGWYYKPKNGKGIYTIKDQQTGEEVSLAFTKGIKARRFMHNAKEFLIREAPSWAKNFFERELK